MKKITIVGIGMGNPRTLTEEAKRTIEGSRVLIGGRRMLEGFRGKDALCVEAVSPEDILKAVEKEDQEEFTVLMSGDVGFFSGAAKLAHQAAERGFQVESLPGISSLQYMCARLCIPWQDVSIVSLHSGDREFTGTVRTSDKTFILTGGERTPAYICERLWEAGLGNVKITVGERLSYEDERIVSGSAEELRGKEFKSLCSLLAENSRPLRPEYRWVMDEELKRGSVPMTKEEVRAVIMSKLRIREDDTVWDVGAGTGSVSVEAALNAPRGEVFSVEEKEEACRLITENAQSFGLSNIRIIKGRAPEALEELPPPHKVFIGGSGGKGREIIEAALRKNRQAVVTAAVITLESLEDMRKGMEEQGLEETDIVQLWAARGEKRGRYHMMKAINPVFIITGRRRGESEG